MRRLIATGLVLMAALLLTACATLSPDYETPQVNITSFALAPDSSSGVPRFNIGVQVINPNRQALPLKGISYAVEVEGHRILSGAKPDLPLIPAYGTADFMIVASPDLFGGARLFTDLLSGQRDHLNYLFKARLDVGSLLPYINVEEKGSFGLSGQQ